MKSNGGSYVALRYPDASWVELGLKSQNTQRTWQKKKVIEEVLSQSKLVSAQECLQVGGFEKRIE
jgi:hypothetical protein